MPKGGKQTKWTQDELMILWTNKTLPTKEIHEMIPNKSYKAVKNYKGYFLRITDEKDAYIREHHSLLAPSSIDENLGLVKGTTSSYCRMLNLPTIFREGSYTDHEISTLEKYCGLKGYSYRDIADILGTNEGRVRIMASKLGISNRFRMTKEEKHEISTAYLTEGKSLSELAEQFNRSIPAIRNILHRLGIYSTNSSSIYSINKCEEYIMNRITEEFGVSFPSKTKENRDYYWGIIPPFEVDIPFSINGHLFAIEYDGEYWHQHKKEKDLEKERLLKEKGYWFFRISSDDHDSRNPETIERPLGLLFQAIRQISERTFNDHPIGGEIPHQE